jgi:organic radical activating enzyme
MYDEDLEDGSDGEGPLTVPKWDGLISGNRVLVNIETNGTQPLDEDLADWVVSADSMQTEDYENDDGDGFWTPNLPVTLTISPKLSNSGESEDARFPTLLEDRSFFRRHVPIIKAVVNSQEDVNELKVLLKKVHLKYSPRFTYLMAEAATRKQLRTNEPKVAELALKNGLSYTSRLHVTLYDNAPGT